MIRNFKIEDLDIIMELWLNTNILAHNFIDEIYWKDNYVLVKKIMLEATIYVYECDNKIEAFIGLVDNYIAGIFVKSESQSKGIGKKLLYYVKNKNKELFLSVYEKNDGAVRFYLRENFVIIKNQIDGNTGEEELFMKWEF